MTDNTSICAVLLAGGKSQRMGQNKAFLELGEKTFLDIALEKLCCLDVDEILVSGDPDIFSPAIDTGKYAKQITVIGDTIKDKGPLGGLYSCFCHTKCSSALVVTTDTPLISADTLNSLIMHHRDNNKDASVLAAASHIEPLIAVYRTGTRDIIKELLDNDRLSMRSLIDRIDTCFPDLNPDPSELYNCNTKEDYLILISHLP